MILLERDGVITYPQALGIPNIQNWSWCPGAIEAIACLQDAGYQLVVHSNQPWVGEGLFSRDDYYELMAAVKRDYFWHLWSHKELQNKSNRGFPWSVACFHRRDEGCTCRKPLTGLWDEQIRPMFDRIDTANSWFVDHHFENLEVGRKAGLNLAWITHATDDVQEPLDYDVFGSLHHFAETLLKKKIAWIAHPVASGRPRQPQPSPVS